MMRKLMRNNPLSFFYLAPKQYLSIDVPPLQVGPLVKVLVGYVPSVEWIHE